jgi:transcriptional regulator with XRE-family HTH domain/anti-sigma regulatory factor (Ser/Thr protein kinase)
VPGDVIPLGARLRRRREELGITQAQAARQLDVARTAYRLWEMEAARPAPDRWRVIARWLGISMSAMLLAGELLDEQEALEAEQAALAAGLTTTGWDDESGASGGDFFSQERAMIADQARAGTISSVQAAGLRTVLARIQDITADGASPGWHPGQFQKRFPSDPLAPALARAALATTAIGIPLADFDNAMLLTSELVTNSVRHSGSDTVDVAIAVEAERLRIAVSDQSTQSIRPRTGEGEGGWGLILIAELATRWGVERRSRGKTIWIEFDLLP